MVAPSLDACVPVAFLLVDQATKASCSNMDVRIGVEIIEKALR